MKSKSIPKIYKRIPKKKMTYNAKLISKMRTRLRNPQFKRV